MKIKLTEPNKEFSSSELLEDLKQVSRVLNKESVTIREYKELGKYSFQTLKKRFGSWKSALESAGLEESRRAWGGALSETRIPSKLLLQDMQRVAKGLKNKSITISEYEDQGKFGASTISKRFGGWNKAKEASGLGITRVYNSTEHDYFENILNVWEVLGRQPKYNEMTGPLSKFHISSYERKFGTWRIALKQFVEFMNEEIDSNDAKSQQPTEEPSDVTIKERELSKQPITSSISKKRSNRKANLRQRHHVLKRDNFRCVFCGMSPAISLSCVLHIDHIVPWSKGGETVEENLQTLCSKCNIGKSNEE